MPKSAGKQRTVATTVPPSAEAQIKQLAWERHTKPAEIIREAIMEYLRNRPSKAPIPTDDAANPSNAGATVLPMATRASNAEALLAEIATLVSRHTATTGQVDADESNPTGPEIGFHRRSRGATVHRLATRTAVIKENRKFARAG